MDTRYWGPSGWRLLHSIAQAGRGPLHSFFTSVAFVLPCKFCRQSFSEYVQGDPIPRRAADFPRWLWRIHNRVNAKLRGQGLPTAPDPPFETVKQVYEDRLASGCTSTVFEGWEFLFSVAESHPTGRQGRSSAPIQGHPPLDDLAKAPPLERNRWNVMSPEERLPYYAKFWTLLPQVFPFPEWTTAWKKAAGRDALSTNRQEFLKEIWAIRRKMEEELELRNKTAFHLLCKELRTFRSGCGRTTRGKTCRRKRESK